MLLEALTLRSAKLERLAQTVAQLAAERLALDGGGSNGGGSVIAAAIRGGSSFLPVWRAPRQLGEAAEEMVLALDAQRATLTVLDEAELGGGDDGGRGGEPPPAAIALPFEAIPMLYLGYQACHQRIATAVSAAAGDGARARRGSDGGGGGGAGGEATSFGLAVACDGAPLPLFVETAAELREVAAALHVARAPAAAPVPQLHEGTLLAAPPGSTLGSHLMSWGELWAVLLPGQLLLLPHAAARRPKRVLALGGATLQPAGARVVAQPRAALRRLVHRARGAQQASVRRRRAALAEARRRRRPTRRRRRRPRPGRRGGDGGAAQRVRAVPRARPPRASGSRALQRELASAEATLAAATRAGDEKIAAARASLRGAPTAATPTRDARTPTAPSPAAGLGARDIARAHRPRRRRRALGGADAAAAAGVDEANDALLAEARVVDRRIRQLQRAVVLLSAADWRWEASVGGGRTLWEVWAESLATARAAPPPPRAPTARAPPRARRRRRRATRRRSRRRCRAST